MYSIESNYLERRLQFCINGHLDQKFRSSIKIEFLEMPIVTHQCGKLSLKIVKRVWALNFKTRFMGLNQLLGWKSMVIDTIFGALPENYKFIKIQMWLRDESWGMYSKHSAKLLSYKAQSFLNIWLRMTKKMDFFQFHNLKIDWESKLIYLIKCCLYPPCILHEKTIIYILSAYLWVFATCLATPVWIFFSIR